MKICFLILLISLSVYASKVSIIKVEGMHCPLCTTAVKKAIKTLDGIEKVSIRLNTKKVKVIYKDNVLLNDILATIKTTSYEGVEISTEKLILK
ncbi:heavy metal-associated domain-containing protein [Halarcobacter sp.]|uniref:heavy-metal-associated domain-containing protein n=1 Tax=Halarcobacter sp. TaxID=2321133 RepID=UPI002AA8A7C9|nr:heavy metal-associated domain-containing protein [Halarcobacter sp.]